MTARLAVSLLEADGHVWLALADAEYLSQSRLELG